MIESVLQWLQTHESRHMLARQVIHPLPQEKQSLMKRGRGLNESSKPSSVFPCSNREVNQENKSRLNFKTVTGNRIHVQDRIREGKRFLPFPLLFHWFLLSHLILSSYAFCCFKPQINCVSLLFVSFCAKIRFFLLNSLVHLETAIYVRAGGWEEEH